MTGRFLTAKEQTDLEISKDVAVWYCRSVERSEALKTKIQSLAEWIRKVASKESDKI